MFTQFALFGQSTYLIQLNGMEFDVSRSQSLLSATWGRKSHKQARNGRTESETEIKLSSFYFRMYPISRPSKLRYCALDNIPAVRAVGLAIEDHIVRGKSLFDFCLPVANLTGISDREGRQSDHRQGCNDKSNLHDVFSKEGQRRMNFWNPSFFPFFWSLFIRLVPTFWDHQIFEVFTLLLSQGVHYSSTIFVHQECLITLFSSNLF